MKGLVCHAQLAFLAASGAELATGAPVAAQLREAPILVALTFVAFSAASLVRFQHHRSARSCPQLHEGLFSLAHGCADSHPQGSKAEQGCRPLQPNSGAA